MSDDRENPLLTPEEQQYDKALRSTFDRMKADLRDAARDAGNARGKYWHLYGAWLDLGTGSRASMVYTLENDQERPDPIYVDVEVRKDREPVSCVLMATFDHKPTDREVHHALPQLFRSTLDSWDDQDEPEDEGDLDEDDGGL